MENFFRQSIHQADLKGKASVWIAVSLLLFSSEVLLVRYFGVFGEMLNRGIHSAALLAIVYSLFQKILLHHQVKDEIIKDCGRPDSADLSNCTVAFIQKKLNQTARSLKAEEEQNIHLEEILVSAARQQLALLLEQRNRCATEKQCRFLESQILDRQAFILRYSE